MLNIRLKYYFGVYRNSGFIGVLASIVCDVFGDLGASLVMRLSDDPVLLLCPCPILSKRVQASRLKRGRNLVVLDRPSDI